jgi:hypothetical protein
MQSWMMLCITKGVIMGPDYKISRFDKCAAIFFWLFLIVVITLGTKLLFFTTFHYIPSPYVFYPSLKIAAIATLICLPLLIRLIQLMFYKGSLFATIMLAIGFAATIFIISGIGLNYINQYNPKTPIETIEAKVIAKKISVRWTRRGKKKSFYHVYLDLWTTYLGALPNPLDMQRHDIYPLVDIGDVVSIKIQKGNLGYYYFTQLIVEKNNQIVNL